MMAWGSALTSVTFQLDAACNLLDHDPQTVRTLLTELKGQMQTSIADIRRLVYNLRPPILDEWGLVAALREQVAQYQLNQVQVTVDVPESLPALPAAVEVAACAAFLCTRPAVVGEAANGQEAITQAIELQPDIILMDLHMPELNGVEATRQIMQAIPHTGILVLTMLEDDASVFAAMRAGARGYLLKGADQAEVLRAIDVVAHGEAIFSPSIARRLMQYFANMQPILPQAAFPDLTEREREILGLIALGKSNAEIP